MDSPRPLPRRVLIANRGEIAVRIGRTCRVLGVGIGAVWTPVESPGAVHVAVADDAREVPSYLDVSALLDAARQMSCDAVHPGYGFLSESAEFADAVERAGLIWIGPPASAIAAMGSKTAARQTMQQAGVPVVPGTIAADPAQLVELARGLGLPLLVKPSAGGGGKGMARVDRLEDLERAASEASAQALASFGDGEVYAERLLERPRHVEIQVMADAHGRVVALGERECSIQRRHQKVIEESPSPAVTPDVRQRISAAAVDAARAVGYRNAGTVEFLLAPDGSFYFLEMNTRLQVEHPVTEWVTGLDLVKLQLEIAAGRELDESLEHVILRGHAIEARVCAEDPAAGYLPQSGRIEVLSEPAGPWVRVDSSLREGDELGMDFDPLLAKVTAFGSDRETARIRLAEALSRFVLLGVRSNIDFIQDVLAHRAFVDAELSTSFLGDHFPTWPVGARLSPAALAATALPVGSSAESSTSGATPSHFDPWDSLKGSMGGSR